MGYMIEITESKAEKLSENIEKSLRYMGKAMQCVEELMEEGGMGQREGGYGNRENYGGRSMMGQRGGYGNRGGGGYGNRDNEDWEEDEEMGERRGVRGSGRGRR